MTPGADKGRRTAGGARLLRLWGGLHRLPGGTRLFSRLIGFWVPYSGTIKARIVEFRAGHVRALLSDRHGVRNHLNSIHAVALVNFGELTSGLALNAAMPAGMRGIVTRIEIEYFKKARGALHAESDCSIPAFSDTADMVVICDIYDAGDERVARTRVSWRLGWEGTA